MADQDGEAQNSHLGLPQQGQNSRSESEPGLDQGQPPDQQAPPQPAPPQPTPLSATALASVPVLAQAQSGSGAGRDGNDSRSLSSFSVGLSVDTDDSDAFSDLGDMDIARSSVSASSSVYQFVEENGRTYHRYKQGKYLLPNDEQEQDRLDLQHSLAKRLLGDRLYLAPIGPVHRVLDIGTGTGIWAVEFAEEHPEADVLGTDLSPIQPDHVPPNLRFEVDDIEDEWIYSAPFDYIHGRYIFPSLRDGPQTIRRMYDNLRPGGYVEVMETLMVIEAVDESLRGSVLLRWHQLILDGVRRMGRDPMVPLRCRQWLADAGFVNVTERKFAVPVGPWARGDENKLRGELMLVNLLEAAQAITMNICTKVWGWSTQEVELFLVDVRTALKNKAHHGYVPVLCLYAQKPEAPR